MVIGYLPDGWTWTTIGNIADTTSGGTPLRSHPEYYDGNIPWLKSGELRDGIIRDAEETITDAGLKNSSAKYFSKDTVVVALYGATVGRTGILGFDATTNQAVCGISPRNNSFSSKYMFYWLQSQRQNLINQSVGGAQPNISQGIIRNLPFPLSPLPEQERIVAKIEELFSQLEAGRAALKRVRAGLKRYKASVLKAAVEGRLLDVGADGIRPLSEEASPAQTGRTPYGDDAPSISGRTPSALTEGELPDGWQWVKVGDIVEHRLGKMLDKEKNKGELRPYLRNINVRWFGFDLSDIQYMRVTDVELENITVRKGDLVVCEGGEPGRAAVWNKDEPFIIQKALHRVRASADVLPTYLMYCLASDANTGRLEKYFTGSTIMHFTGQAFRAYEIPLPPLAEQRRIVAEVERRLSVVIEVESVLAASVARAGRLRQSLLKNAFEGKLL